MSTEETKPTTTAEQVTSAISEAASKVTDEAAALFGSAKEAVTGETKTTETTTEVKSIAEAAPVRERIPARNQKCSREMYSISLGISREETGRAVLVFVEAQMTDSCL